MPSWDTGLCDCCANPGGCGLCCRASFCPCTVLGDINGRMNGPGGFCGGCCVAGLLGNECCCPCFCMGFLAPQVAAKSGFQESGCKACCLTACPCTTVCYMCQVWRQTEIQRTGGAPRQLEMK
ncbi:unnamed protein product [Polarella glacialis]|uniref:Uncharacterized protein n=1 Tax=Polarella glacialis TaxID=89957 RepID=A0A813FT02_POLGL|nr:unnamed protein product [Polarella glacialis]|mmetsp:Transcript_56800/g.102024  ORF Transcript_56800/g.102024 Transcript_56800/m.102024 type:complete len:123 (+) Transcript_56800:81-449(+)